MTQLAINAAWPIVVLVATTIVARSTELAVKEMRKNTRLKDLAYIAEVCGDALQAAIRTTNGSPSPQAIAVAEQAAKKVIVAALPSISEALSAELDTLITHHVAAAAGQPVTAPGGATVVWPRPT